MVLLCWNCAPNFCSTMDRDDSPGDDKQGHHRHARLRHHSRMQSPCAFPACAEYKEAPCTCLCQVRGWYCLGYCGYPKAAPHRHWCGECYRTEYFAGDFMVNGFGLIDQTPYRCSFCLASPAYICTQCGKWVCGNCFGLHLPCRPDRQVLNNLHQTHEFSEEAVLNSLLLSPSLLTELHRLS